MIEVRRMRDGDPLEFEVTLRDRNGETRHHVTMTKDTCERLTRGEHAPEHGLEAVFRFLLDRERRRQSSAASTSR